MSRISNIVTLGAAMLLAIGTAASAGPMMGNPTLGVTKVNPLVHKVHRCHSGWRYAYVPEVGYEQEHRHTGSRCNVILRDSGRSGGVYRGYECHGDPRRHRHRGWGTTYHSHYGSRCEVDVWEQRPRGYRGRGCLQVGPVTVCN